MTAAVPERILAIKLADLGDVLVTEPALRSLRTAFPNARIDVLTTPTAAGLVPYLGDSYNVLTFPKHEFDSPRSLMRPGHALRLTRFGRSLRAARYDTVAVFHHLTTPAGALKFRALARATGAATVAGLDNGRGTFLTHRAVDLGFGKRHSVEYMLDVARQLGGATVDPQPTLCGTPKRKSSFNSAMPEQYAAIFPTTGPFAPGRNWPATSFAALARRLAKEGLTPVVLGGHDATDAAHLVVSQAPNAVDLTAKTSLGDVIRIVQNARVTITGDSFPGHLADALGTPVVSIFGPSNHRAWSPHGAMQSGSGRASTSIVLRHEVPCSPCLYTGYRLGRPNGCPVRTCLHSVTPDDVMSAVGVVIGGSQ